MASFRRGAMDIDAAGARSGVRLLGKQMAVSSNLTCGLGSFCPSRTVAVQAHRRRREQSSILWWGLKKSRNMLLWRNRQRSRLVSGRFRVRLPGEAP